MASRSSHDGMTNRSNLILYLDIDAFLPSVEQARFPNLRGRAVVVGSGVVASASYEARQYGVHAGMPISKAATICPDLVVLKGHRPTYQAFAQEIFEHCRKISPMVEIEFDEIYCDISASSQWRSDPLRLAKDLRQRIFRSTNLSVSIGIGSNKMIAKLAGKDAKPGGIGIVMPGEEETFMESRQVSDVPGIGPSLEALLARMGITHVRHLKTLSISHLRMLFGNNAYLMYERLRGRDPGQVVTRKKSIWRETSFESATIDIDRIDATLAYLVERACRSARMLGVLPRRICVKVRYEDGRMAISCRKMACHCLLDCLVLSTARDLLASLIERSSIRLVGVSLANLTSVDQVQASLFDRAEASKLEKLYQTLDQIRLRFGHSSIIAGKSISLIDTLERDTYGYILRTPSLTK